MKQILITLITAFLITSPVGAQAPASDQVVALANARIPKLIASGYLRVDAGSGQAWLDPSAWLVIDAQQKEALTIMIATYCAPKYPSVTLFDKQSGKELASYGPFQGFKIP